MTENETAAIVGATGGAGATRLSIELAATLGRAGRDVAVLDAAFATQGLSQYVRGRIDRDVTTLCTTGSTDLEAALVDLPADVPGRVAVCPAYASFSQVASAKHPEAAEQLERLLDRAAERFEYVLVDTPPVADNPSVAAVDGADRVVAVTPATQRGDDGLRRLQDRLADVGEAADRVLANRAPEGQVLGERDRDATVPDADVAIPEHEVTGVTGAPVCADPGTGDFEPAVAKAAEAIFETKLGLEFPSKGLLSFR